MKTNDSSNSGTQSFLTGAILLANLDFTGLADYALKAAIGGVIWLAFKMTGDYLSQRMRDKQK